MTATGRDTTHQGTSPNQQKEQRQQKRGPGTAREEGLEVKLQGRREGRKRPARTDLLSTPFPNLQDDAAMQPLENDLSRDEIAFARDGFTERAQRSMCADHRGVGDILSEEGWEVWAVVVKFGRAPGLGAARLKCPGRCTRCQGRDQEPRCQQCSYLI